MKWGDGMQDRIRINNTDIYQPDKGLSYKFETTYTSDSSRVQTGKGHFTALFTVEQLNYKATHIPQEEATKIIKMVARGTNFTLHYFSIFYGQWRDGTFYVGQGDMAIGSLEDDNRYLDSLNFNMTGVDPV